MDDNAVHLDDQALPFWVEVTEDGDDDSMGILGGGNPELRMVPLGPLRKNLAATVDALQQVFADVAARGGTLPLAEAQLSFQVKSSPEDNWLRSLSISTDQYRMSQIALPSWGSRYLTPCPPLNS